MLFSQRIGKRPIKKALQFEQVDNELRNSLWTIVYETHILSYCDPSQDMLDVSAPKIRNSNLWSFVFKFWFDILKSPSDTIPHGVKECIDYIRNWFNKAKWYEIYDLVQISIYTFPLSNNNSLKDYINFINIVLKKEKSAYRVIGKEIVPITNEEEIQTIEEATNLPTKYKAVETHFNNAIKHFADRQNPDFPNSIKEAMCSIESLARIVTGQENATLGKLTGHLPIHSAMRSALNKMYGYSSDEGGIRHGAIEEININFNLTKFMLVICSAFINYTISEIES